MTTLKAQIKPLRKMQTSLFTSLEEARSWTEKNKSTGCICPCCNQILKVYKRALNSVMSRCLIRLYWLDNNDKNLIDIKLVELTGDDYLNWGSNDDYITNFVSQKLGIVFKP